jgi:hypothetical protein
MKNHTPGPWYLAKGTDAVYIRASHGCVAKGTAEVAKSVHCTRSNAKNLQLSAKAPEMEVLLQRFLAGVDKRVRGEDEPSGVFEELVEDARSLLKALKEDPTYV